LGLASYYRKFVRHFGVLSKPLTSLLKKHTIFIWTSVQDQAFQALKEALCFVPVLKLPDFPALLPLKQMIVRLELVLC
jgi:hypothetical protein